MTVGEYIPEYILARISAAVMFSIMNTEPKIDSLSEIGDFRVTFYYLVYKIHILMSDQNSANLRKSYGIGY